MCRAGHESRGVGRVGIHVEGKLGEVIRAIAFEIALAIILQATEVLLLPKIGEVVAVFVFVEGVASVHVEDDWQHGTRRVHEAHVVALVRFPRPGRGVERLIQRAVCAEGDVMLRAAVAGQRALFDANLHGGIVRRGVFETGGFRRDGNAVEQRAVGGDVGAHGAGVEWDHGQHADCSAVRRAADGKGRAVV